MINLQLDRSRSRELITTCEQVIPMNPLINLNLLQKKGRAMHIDLQTDILTHVKRLIYIAVGLFSLCRTANSQKPEVNATPTAQLGLLSVPTSLALSRDGKLLAGAGKDGSVILWDTSSGIEIRRFPQQYGFSTDLLFHPDGRHLVVSAPVGSGLEGIQSLRIFDITTGTLLPLDNGPDDSVSSLGINADGTLLCALGASSPFFWRITYKVLVGIDDSSKSLNNHLSNCAADGSRFIYLDDKNTIVIVNSLGSRTVLPLRPTVEVVGLAVSGENQRVAVLLADGSLVLYDARSAKPLWKLKDLPTGHLRFSGNGQRLLVADCRVAKLIDSRTGEFIWSMSDKNTSNTSTLSSQRECKSALSEDGNLVGLVHGDDPTIDIYNILSEKPVRIQSAIAPVIALSWTADEHYLIALNKIISMWDLQAGALVRRFGENDDLLRSAATSPDGRFVFGASISGLIYEWEAETGRLVTVLRGHQGPIPMFVVSNDGRRAVSAGDDGTLRYWDLNTHLQLWSIPSGRLTALAISSNGLEIATGGPRNKLRFWDVKSATESRTKLQAIDDDDGTQMRGIHSLSYSSDGRRLIAGLGDKSSYSWDISNGKTTRYGPRAVDTAPQVVKSVDFSPDGKMALSSSGYGAITLWQASDGKPIHQLHGHAGAVNAAQYSPSGKFVASAGTDATLRIWDVDTGNELVKLISYVDGGWIALDNAGRYDAPNGGDAVDNAAGLRWIFSDDPMRSFPVQLLMRDYYQPRLIPLTLSGQLKNSRLPAIASLNRVQPEVSEPAIHIDPNSSEAEVSIKAGAKEDKSQKNAKTVTAAYDLRLFRNGQLVGQWPQPIAGSDGPDDIKAWRKVSQIPMTSGETSGEHTFRVALPSRDRDKPVVFTAYAFNEDRVKSETVTNAVFRVPKDMPVRTPRAYVITVGVNGYENPNRDLNFAAKDARDMGAVLSNVSGYELVSLTLLSDKDQAGAWTVNQATKDNIRAVLELLGGKSETERDRLKAVRGIDQQTVDRLRKATPDDLVLIAFSAHGYTAPSGKFYLLPSNSGTESDITPETLLKFISSEDLSQWLREVDAGDMAMIIDACHSAASVETRGFKPGPLGDRGLGQLAYDKGMIILAATQASDVALEAKKIKHGLLTYALVHDGLEFTTSTPRRRNADLDRNGTLSLKEWLQYGERRVPSLYEELRYGKAPKPRDAIPAPDWRQSPNRNSQTPSLFDFQRNPRAIELLR
jgi:WD40 repeat protein/uncharacterized caspase-like protein